MSEKQLSILGRDGCIGNDLSHRLCMIKRPRGGFHWESEISQRIQLVVAPGRRDSLGISGEQSLLAGEE